jgi:hypothetical protein
MRIVAEGLSVVESKVKERTCSSDSEKKEKSLRKREIKLDATKLY